MRGIRRTYGSAKIRKAPAVAGKVLGMVATPSAAGRFELSEMTVRAVDMG